MSNPITIAYNNFARGVIDSDVNGRFDLPIYANGLKQCYNFYTNFKGNLVFRTGMKQVDKLPEQVYIKPFKFNQEQNYLFAFGDKKLYMYTFDANNNFVRITLKDGNDQDVDFYNTLYTLAEAEKIRYTQNYDLMYWAHDQHPPQQVKRVAADKFEIGDHTITGNPFDDPDTGETGYPSQTMFYSGRLWYGGATKKPTNVWMSELDNFNNFEVPAQVLPDSPFNFRLTDIAEKIEWLYPGEGSLVAGAADGISPINGGSYNVAITAENVKGNRSSVDGCNDTFPMLKDGDVFYIGSNNRYTHAFNYDFLTEKFVAPDVNKTTYDITKGGIKKIIDKKDRDDLMYYLKNNGDLLTFNYNQAENITGWHLQATNGFIHDIEVISDNFGKPVVFLVVERNGIFYLERLSDIVEFGQRSDFQTDLTPGMSQSEINEVKARDDEAFRRCISNNLRECIYLDNAQVFSDFNDTVTLTYDDNAKTLTADASYFSAADVGKYIEIFSESCYDKGRFEITEFTNDTTVTVNVILEPTLTEFKTFYRSISVIQVGTDYDGLTLSVVNDGGYLGDFVVGDLMDDEGVQVQAAGEINIGKQASVVYAGFSYVGVAETFPVGGQLGTGDNSQRNQNTISEIDIRCVNTAGGFVGTSFYDVEPVQKMKQGSFNYLPADPINGTISIGYTDNASVDKTIFVKQDLPLPMFVTCVFVGLINGSDL